MARRKKATPSKSESEASILPRPRKRTPVAGLKRVASKGRVYFYHRASGKRLKFDPNSVDGLLEIKRLDELAARADKDAGSLAAIIRAYQDPAAGRAGRIRPFRLLGDRTKLDYQEAFDAIAADAPEMLPDDMRPRHIQLIVDRAGEARGWSFGARLLVALRAVINWAIYHELCERNPCKGVLAPARDKSIEQGNRRWTEQELIELWAAAPDALRVALALGLYAGLRAQDARPIPWTAYDGSRLRWRAKKNGQAIDIACTGPLKAVLDEARARARGPTILESKLGTQFSKPGLEALLARTRDPLVKAGRIGAGLTFHGLRITLASMAKEAGASDQAIAAVIHDRSREMAIRYSRGADQSLIGDAVRRDLLERHTAVFSARLENRMENRDGESRPQPLEPASNVRILKGKSPLRRGARVAE